MCQLSVEINLILVSHNKDVILGYEEEVDIT